VIKTKGTGKRQWRENDEGEISKYESRGCVFLWFFARCPGSYRCGLRFDSFLVAYVISRRMSRKILRLCGFFRIAPRAGQREFACFCRETKSGLQKRGRFRNRRLCNLSAENLQKEAYSAAKRRWHARGKAAPKHLDDSFWQMCVLLGKPSKIRERLFALAAFQ